MSGFENTGAFYDALAARAGRLERERALIERCLAQAPGARVLDLACGTGIHALFLAESGCTVSAVDASESMIAYARQHRPHPNIAYTVADMREPGPGEWDAAFCLGNSLSLLSAPGDLAEVLAVVGGQLAPGGLFLANVLNYAAAAAREPRHRVERVAVEGSEVVAVKSLVPHGGRTLLALNFFAMAGAEVRRLSDMAVLRHWDRAALVEAAGQAGLREAWCAGAFDGTAYDLETSPDLILCFQRC